MTAPAHSPAPWSYEYNPYRFCQEPHGIETELAAFEVFDADCNKIFDTNEDTPCELQEANARLAASAPALLRKCFDNARAMLRAADLLRELGFDAMAIVLHSRCEATFRAIDEAMGARS